MHIPDHTSQIRHPGSQSGFTLFEILIVLVILGICSSLLFSRLANFLTEGDLASASRMVIGEVNRLRGMAAYTHAEQFLELDMERQVIYAMGAGEGPGTSPSALEASPAEGRSLPEGVRLEDVVIHPRGKVQQGVARIRFFADGSVERALIHLRNSREEVYTLALNPLTGFVEIRDTYVDERIQ